MTIGKVPTGAEVRARRVDLTRALVRETILEDDFDRFRVVVESLADKTDADGDSSGGRIGGAAASGSPTMTARTFPNPGW